MNKVVKKTTFDKYCVPLMEFIVKNNYVPTWTHAMEITKCPSRATMSSVFKILEDMCIIHRVPGQRYAPVRDFSKVQKLYFSDK